MIVKCDKECEFNFSVLPPLYLPFYNRWGKNAYYKYEAFSLDIYGQVDSSQNQWFDELQKKISILRLLRRACAV